MAQLFYQRNSDLWPSVSTVATSGSRYCIRLDMAVLLNGIWGHRHMTEFDPAAVRADSWRSVEREGLRTNPALPLLDQNMQLQPITASQKDCCA